jgi:hypothetical protein
MPLGTFPDSQKATFMKTTVLWLIVVTAGVLGALYFWPEDKQISPRPPEAPAVAPAPKPAIRHPVESVDASKNALPPLSESDGPLSEAIAGLFAHKLPEFVYLKNIVHRLVATVDNLPRDYVAPRLLPVSPVPGLPIIEGSGDDLVLSPKNSDRYRPYVRLAEAIPTDASVAVYARFYPLFQEQYENLGYPDKYFNDRVVEVIDHLLATPEIEEPLRLIQPRVLYDFADPKLQKLSAGQKILLRMGPANRLKLKAKLREIRDRLVSMTP